MLFSMMDGATKLPHLEAREVGYCVPRINQLLTMNESQREDVTSQAFLGRLSDMAGANYLEKGASGKL